MQSLPQILITLAFSYIFSLYILSTISLEISNNYNTSFPIKREYCGGEYFIDKEKEIICSDEYNNLTTEINEKINVICGGFVLTKGGAYRIINNETFSIIYLTNSATYFIDSINNITTENKLTSNFNFFISDGFTISVIDHRVLYYECADHCKNRYFCEKNIYYYI